MRLHGASAATFTTGATGATLATCAACSALTRGTSLTTRAASTSRRLDSHFILTAQEKHGDKQACKSLFA